MSADGDVCNECGNPSVTDCRRCDLRVCEGHISETADTLGPLCTSCRDEDLYDLQDRRGEES